MTHVSLFSGIGGLDLAAEWAGFRTIQFVERDPFCQKVLAKHWPEVPIHDDITTFDGDTRSGCTVISGGFPCQDISVAGHRKGIRGERSGLVWRMLDVVEQARPAWVVFENSPQIVNLGVDELQSYLETIGYTSRSIEVSAYAVGASFLGIRWFLIAKALCEGSQGSAEAGILPSVGLAGEESARVSSDESIESTVRERCAREPRRRTGQESENGFTPLPPGHWSEWDHKPLLVRGVDGIPTGVDRRRWESRIRALGNAVVPQQAYPIFKAIADYEASRS